MPAIITDTTRINILEALLTEVNTTSTDTNRYYITIGKSDQYNTNDTTITPVRTKAQERDVRNNMQSVKKVEATSFVIPRQNWTGNREYSAYSDAVEGIPTNSYYVMNEINEVFICLKQPKNNAGVGQVSVNEPTAPSGANINVPFTTADGYVWKFLYQISAGQANNFLSANFMPIEKVIKDSADCNTFELLQKKVQATALKGQILGIEVTSGGSGYTSAPVTIRGNGVNGFATATMSGGAITKIDMDSHGFIGLGRNYDYAEVVIGGNGTGAKARAIIGPPDGIGADPRNDLKSNSLMFNIKPNGIVQSTLFPSGDFIVGNSFRQIGLLKNPLQGDSATAGVNFNLTSGRAMRAFRDSNAVDFDAIKGQIMSDASTPPIKAILDIVTDDEASKVKGQNMIMLYHQNDSTGFGVFPITPGNPINITAGGITRAIDSDLPPQVDPYSGELLYVENRASILRDASQQEDIKVIITV